MSAENLISIDEAIESGDPELIAQALEFEESKEEKAVEETFKAEEEIPKVEKESDPVPANGSEDEASKAIESKDGKHTIPYSVLESARETNRQLREQLEAQQSANTELSQKSQQNETAIANVTAQLEAKGLDTDSMFSNPDDISPEQWKEIEDDYGSMGKMMKTLLANQEAMASQGPAAQPAQAAPEENPVVSAIDANPDLSGWQKTDPDRWAHVVQMDEQLKGDPDWANKSLDERFAQAAKLTKTAFGDNLTIQDRANKIIQEKTQATPDSLTDIGGGPSGTKSDFQAMESMTSEQIEARMESMTTAQVDELFQNGF
jgi:hypothetical protein